MTTYFDELVDEIAGPERRILLHVKPYRLNLPRNEFSGGASYKRVARLSIGMLNLIYPPDFEKDFVCNLEKTS